MPYAKKLDKPRKVKLDEYDPDDNDGVSEEIALEEVAKLGIELAKLQELLYASSVHSVLVVLQGMDTSGKDGTISHVFHYVNPQSVSVAAFKQPTPEEIAHDFLWRVHQKAPPKGQMTIFNRSHYEDVLAVRVHELVPEKVWKGRYAEINHFEEQLAASNTIILKFFLHISKKEQEKRLLAREEDVSKGWKLSAGDWQERKYWDDYVEAYEDALGKTATEQAPWYIVPANHKWYRNLAIAETLVSTLRGHKNEWEAKLTEISKKARAELAQMRSQTDPVERSKHSSVRTGAKEN